MAQEKHRKPCCQSSGARKRDTLQCAPMPTPFSAALVSSLCKRFDLHCLLVYQSTNDSQIGWDQCQLSVMFHTHTLLCEMAGIIIVASQTTLASFVHTSQNYRVIIENIVPTFSSSVCIQWNTRANDCSAHATFPLACESWLSILHNSIENTFIYPSYGVTVCRSILRYHCFGANMNDPCSRNNNAKPCLCQMKRKLRKKGTLDK